jgi:tRNA A37 threonylcarbamoyladenosine dehydratase
MYDQVNLAEALRRAGFGEITLVDFKTSSIPSWDLVALDTDAGLEYKPKSLYMEAKR